MPLYEVCASHESAVFSGAAIVVPQIEIDEVNGLGERRTLEQALTAETIHQGFGPRDIVIRCGYDFFRLFVHAIDD